MIRALMVSSSLVLAIFAGCGSQEPVPTEPSVTSEAAATETATAVPTETSAPTATAATSSAPATSAGASATTALASCGSFTKWTPKLAKASFTWSETPKLEDAPKDGVFASVGAETFEIEKVEIRIDKKAKEWTLEAKAGPLGPSLDFKGAPQVGAAITQAWGPGGGSGNGGFFQTPRSGTKAECHPHTTSLNGSNARSVKLTKIDAKAKTADGSFVTTWSWTDSDGVKRQLWAAGTFKDAKIIE